MMENGTLIALVDENDTITGFEEKLVVHQKGLLHRAFSIFIFNDKNELLIHRRAIEKYHSGGLWTNTCCSHLLQGEEFETSIHNRLRLEMGFDCPLEFAFKFRYSTTFSNALIENELDHVFIGRFNGVPLPDPEEVCDWKWANPDDLIQDFALNGQNYTYWFKMAFHRIAFSKVNPKS
jgi:isopentenyl-diphosphate Delta-isomerase